MRTVRQNFFESSWMRKVIKFLALLTSGVLAVRWFFDPTGVYEPAIVLMGIAVAFSDQFSGKRSTQPIALEAGTPVSAPAPAVEPKRVEAEPLPPYVWTSTSEFFAERFGSAFPGTRETRWFNGQHAVERLSRLLKAPLTFRGRGDGELSPLWWFGRGNLQVEHFEQVDSKTVLINSDEYRIARIAAVYSTSYRRLWVYVEAEPMTPTGLYATQSEFLATASAEGKSYTEEYGLLDDGRKITRAEYDDGHAEVDGKIIDVSGRTRLRARHLTPYNFILCPHDSPINNLNFDAELERSLDSVLRNPSSFVALANKVETLPINRFE